MINKPLDNRLFNIDVLVLNKSNTQGMLEVTSNNVFEPNSQIFDSNGLFSTNIFGPIGTTMRNERHGYINLHLGILHPLVFEHITSLKTYYKDIIEGKVYAKFDPKEGDFVITPDGKGNTGFSFFLDNMDKLKFQPTESAQRTFKIEIIKKYAKKEALIDKWLVLPAGMRDYSIDSKGVPSEDEINNIYRKLMSATGLLKNINTTNSASLDGVRLRIQKITLEIFNYIKSLLDGKNKFIQGKWGKRSITNGTRNVLTGLPTNVLNLKDANRITSNHTIVGIHQYCSAITPITMNRLHSEFIYKFLNPNSDTAKLVDPKTLETKLVTIPVSARDQWLSLEKLTSIMKRLASDELKVTPAMVDKYYLMLVYDDGDNVVLLNSSDEITDEMNREYIRPITLVELFYIAVEPVKDKYPCFVTRYPVAGLGGIYPSLVYLKTSGKGRTVNLQKDGQVRQVIEYPILTEKFFNSVSVSGTHLKRLGGDYDGDTVGFNVVYTEESISEIKKLLASKEMYLTPDGEMTYSANNDVLDLTLSHLTE